MSAGHFRVVCRSRRHEGVHPLDDRCVISDVVRDALHRGYRVVELFECEPVKSPWTHRVRVVRGIRPTARSDCSFVLILHSVIILAVSFDGTTSRIGSETNLPVSFSLTPAEPPSGVQVSRSLTCFPRRVYSAGIPAER